MKIWKNNLMESFRYFSTGFPSLFFQIFSLFMQVSKEFSYSVARFILLKPSSWVRHMLAQIRLQFKIRTIHEVGFAEGAEGLLEVGVGGLDGVGGLKVGFDFGVVAGEVVDFVKIDSSSLPHA